MDLKDSFQDVIIVKALTLIGAVYAPSPVLKAAAQLEKNDVTERCRELAFDGE